MKYITVLILALLALTLFFVMDSDAAFFGLFDKSKTDISAVKQESSHIKNELNALKTEVAKMNNSMKANADGINGVNNSLKANGDLIQNTTNDTKLMIYIISALLSICTGLIGILGKVIMVLVKTKTNVTTMRTELESTRLYKDNLKADLTKRNQELDKLRMQGVLK